MFINLYFQRMMPLGTRLKLIAGFYRNFFVASLAISLTCAYLLMELGVASLFYLFWFRVITLGLIVYYIRDYKKRDFYFYDNLGMSRRTLWTVTMLCEAMLFILLITLALNLR